MAAQDRNLLIQAIMGSVTNDVLRSAQVPVLAVTPAKNSVPAGQRASISTVLVPLDGSPDRAVKAVEQFGLDGPLERWRRLRETIHQQVCDAGFDRNLNSFVQYYGAQQVDASLLMIPLVGFLPADDPRMQGTVRAVQDRLTHNGFVTRYGESPEVDGLTGKEGAFLLCTLWLADNLALQGRMAEARELFDRVLAVRNDVGLYSEQYEPSTRRFLGNFPQAFSHVGLINTARNLDRAGGPGEDRPRG